MEGVELINPNTSVKMLEQTQAQAEQLLEEVFTREELVRVDGLLSFKYGNRILNVRVLPWHEDEALVEVYAFEELPEQPNQAFLEKLLRYNATLHFGSFALSDKKRVNFSYQLPSSALDRERLIATVQCVAAIANTYLSEKINKTG